MDCDTGRDVRRVKQPDDHSRSVPTELGTAVTGTSRARQREGLIKGREERRRHSPDISPSGTEHPKR